METLFDRVNSAVKNWWLSLILGILYVVLSIFMMFSPAVSFLALAIVFSIMMFVSGIFEIVFSLSNKNTLNGWGWYFACGIIDLLLGLVLICLPGFSMAVIPFIVAFWFMFRGFSAIGTSVDMSRYGLKNWGWYLVFGILAVICAIAIIWQPAAGALTAVYITAFAFLFIGIFRIMISFDLKRLHDHGKDLHKTVDKIQQKIDKLKKEEKE